LEKTHLKKTNTFKKIITRNLIQKMHRKSLHFPLVLGKTSSEKKKINSSRKIVSKISFGKVCTNALIFTNSWNSLGFLGRKIPAK
jgi:hypothetical protein